MNTTEITPLGMCNRESFRAEARSQRCCAVCGSVSGFLAHHVVYEQRLKKDLGLKGDILFDSANALRLCKKHHDDHHGRARVVKTSELTDQNIAYAFHVYGDYAVDYLARYYDNEVEDPRITRLELEDERPDER